MTEFRYVMTKIIFLHLGVKPSLNRSLENKGTQIVPVQMKFKERSTARTYLKITNTNVLLSKIDVSRYH